MSIRKPEVSKIFPKDYGDFAIASSDDVICYFPSQILSHVSCVFRDMFISAGSYDQRGKSSTPVKITEPITILELFLTQIDPNFSRAPIDPKTIEALLNMADKYQTTAILNWFKQEITIRRIDEVASTDTRAFSLSHPALLLSLSIRFDLKEPARCALRELSGCSEEQLAACPNSLRVSALLEIYRLRNVRIQWYQKWIDILARRQPEPVPAALPPNPFDAFYGRRRLPAQPVALNAQPSAIQVCINCTAQRALWTTNMMKAVHAHPNWANFVDAFERPYKCAACDLCWPDKFRSLLPGWKQETNREEAKLPELDLRF